MTKISKLLYFIMTCNYIKFQRYSLYASLILPLLFTSFTFSPWHFGKTIFFQILVEVMVASLFIYWLRVAGEKEKLVLWSKNLIRRINWLDWSVIIFLLVLTITALSGFDVNNSFWGNQARTNGVFTWWHFVIWYLFLRNIFKEKKEWLYFFGVIIAVSLVVSFTIFFPNLLPMSWQSASGGGIIGNRAFAANYLLVAVGLAVYLAIILKGFWKYAVIMATIILLAALFYLGTRGAQLGLVVGVVVGCGLRIVYMSRTKYRRAAFVAACCAVGIVGILVFFGQSNSFRQNWPRLGNLINYHQLISGTGETRLMAWRIALQGIKDKPIVGWGMENYTIVFNKYFNPQFLKHSFQETVWDKPHNWLLEIGISAGVIGILSYISIFCAAGYYILRRQALPPFARAIYAGTLVGYFVANLFLFETSNSLLMWFAVLAFISSQQSIGTEQLSQASGAAQSQASSFKKVWLVGGILCIVILLWKYNVLPLRVSYYLRSAQNAVTAESWADYAQKTLSLPSLFRGESAIFLAERFTQLDKSGISITSTSTVSAALAAAHVLDKESETHPTNPLFAVWSGQMYMVLGEKLNEKYYADAERALLVAYHLSPRKQEFLFFLGRLYLLKKDFSTALAYQKQAVAAAPNISTSHWFLGLTYIASGDKQNGLLEIEQALKLGYYYSLTPNQKLYIIDLYAETQQYDKVIEWYKKFIIEEPENVNWYIKLATAYAVAGKKDLALETVRQAIDMYPPLAPQAAAFIKQYHLQ